MRGGEHVEKKRLLARTLLGWCVPTARWGNVLAELTTLLGLLLLEITVLPSLVGYRIVSLVCPWLTFMWVTRSPLRGVLFLVFAALTLEQHGALPAGLYLCAYGMAGAMIVSLREHVAWQNLFPWLVSFSLVEGWLVLFEGFVTYLREPSFFSYNVSLVLLEVLRHSSGVVLGMVFFLLNHKVLREEVAYGNPSSQ